MQTNSSAIDLKVRNTFNFVVFTLHFNTHKIQFSSLEKEFIAYFFNYLINFFSRFPCLFLFTDYICGGN